MNRFLKVSGVSVTLALAVLATACGGSVASEAPAAAVDGVATKAPVATASHGHLKLAAEALGEVPLRADQRVQIEKLAVTAEAGQAAVRTARGALMSAIADQIATGQIDKTALQAKIDALGTAAASTQVVERAGLEQLHTILDASQRSLFVDTLRDKMQARFAEHAGHKGGHFGGMKARWAELNLSADQEAQIKTIMHDEFSANRGERGEFRGGFERGQKTLDAFKGDAFVLDQVAPAMDVRAKSTEMAGRMIDIASKVLPILTQDQKNIAVQKLRARAAAAETPEGEEGPGAGLL
jgi:Spy/CpxP family protein refolding chaperone